MNRQPIKTRTAWECRSWRLRVLDFAYPDGSVKERGVIDHPGSVVVVPLVGEDVLILKQYRIALESTILELPAGTKERDEESIICARRELREETGYRADDWISLGEIWPAPGITNELMTVYLARELTLDPLPADADEEIEVVDYPLTKLVAIAFDGKLQDAKSVVGILRAAAYLGVLPATRS